MIRLAITDDHPLLLEGIKNILSGSSKLRFVASFSNAGQTLHSEALKDIDVLLLDINLPDMDGIALCGKLHTLWPHLKIIGLTSHKQTSFLKGMLKAGAKGFLVKNTPAEEIIGAIESVYNGQEYIQAEMKELLVAETLKTGHHSSFIPKLTRRELEILKLITEEHTTQEIADKLFLSPKTVETHRQNLMLKLEAKNSIGLVKTALQKGLV
jgi:DNA-binding NarL/FixJ family response regulator